jgi:hypothetical protein
MPPRDAHFLHACIALFPQLEAWGCYVSKVVHKCNKEFGGNFCLPLRKLKGVMVCSFENNKLLQFSAWLLHSFNTLIVIFAF